VHNLYVCHGWSASCDVCVSDPHNACVGDTHNACVSNTDNEYVSDTHNACVGDTHKHACVSDTHNACVSDTYNEYVSDTHNECVSDTHKNYVQGGVDIGCLIFTGLFPQELVSPMISGSFAKRDLQLKVSYAFSPPCSDTMHVCVTYLFEWRD